MTSATAIVLAGGQARRMGGVDKPALRLGGVTLLDRVLRAAAPVCDRLIVVGPVRPTDVNGVEFLTEPTPGGGPVPAVLEAIAAANLEPEEVVLVLAADMPFLTSADLQLLIDAVAADPNCASAAARGTGPDQKTGPNPLLAAYRAGQLQASGEAGKASGRAAAELLAPGTVVVALPERATFNVNSPADLERASAVLAQATRSSPA